MADAITVELLGGPCDGQVMRLEHGTEVVKIPQACFGDLGHIIVLDPLEYRYCRRTSRLGLPLFKLETDHGS